MAIVGASHNPNHTHILETVRAVSVPKYYIGDDVNAAKWKNEKPRLRPIHAYFEEGLEKFLVDLGA